MKPFYPVAHYLARLNPVPVRSMRPSWASPINLVVALIIIFAVVTWLPEWLLAHLPP